MKICKKCGTVQNDERFFCVECGEKLESSLSKESESALNESIRKKMDAYNEKMDPLGIDATMKISAIAAALGIIFSIITVFITDVPSKAAVITPILFFAVTIIDTFCPKLIWTLSKLKDIFQYENFEYLEPSYFYGRMRRFGAIACVVIGFAILIIYFYIS